MTEPLTKQNCNEYSVCVLIWVWVARRGKHSLHIHLPTCLRMLCPLMVGKLPSGKKVAVQAHT